MEPSGEVALLIMARDIVEKKHSLFFDDMNFIIIPVSAPDGRNAHLRVNGNKVNLSTNFIILSEPETRALYATVISRPKGASHFFRASIPKQYFHLSVILKSGA